MRKAAPALQCNESLTWAEYSMKLEGFAFLAALLLMTTAALAADPPLPGAAAAPKATGGPCSGSSSRTRHQPRLGACRSGGSHGCGHPCKTGARSWVFAQEPKWKDVLLQGRGLDWHAALKARSAFRNRKCRGRPSFHSESGQPCSYAARRVVRGKLALIGRAPRRARELYPVGVNSVLRCLSG